MMKFRYIGFLLLLSGCFWLQAAIAQDSEPEADDDSSSDRVEQRDDSYRRQMELEDARSKGRTYVDNTYTQSGELEKIDKLPEESRDNIRDQLVDVIMENGEWKPGDVLEEYPYEPTEAAQADPELMQQEQEAWDEQIEKYHEREAAAFGSYRGPVPGPGNPSGQQGGQQSEGSQGQQGGEQGGGQGGQDGGEGDSGASSAGTYQPYESSASSSEEAVSTAGVSESALDFLRGGQSGAQAPSQSQPQEQEAARPESADQLAEQSQAQVSDQSQPEQQQETPQEIQPDTRGIIAIQDLDKLEGTELPVEPEEPEDR